MKGACTLDVDFERLYDDPIHQHTWWEVYQYFAPLLALRARRQGLTATDVSDVVQQTFVTLVNKVKKGEPDVRDLARDDAIRVVSSYLNKTLSFNIANLRRKTAKAREMSDVLEEMLGLGKVSTHHEPVSAEAWFVWQILNKTLSAEEKSILHNRIHEERGFEEIGKELGISKGTCSQRFYRTIRRARSLIIDEAKKMLLAGEGDKGFLEQLIQRLTPPV